MKFTNHCTQNNLQSRRFAFNWQGIALMSFIAISCCAQQANATNYNLTGAQLFNNPNVIFPNDTPTVVGSSLLFGSGGPTHGKLFQLSLGNFTYSDQILITLNITRKTVDFDPRILLTDGNQMYGVAVSDDSNGSMLPTRFYEGGNVGFYDGSDNGFQNGGYPNVDEAFDVHLKFSFSPTSSTVMGSYLAGTTQFSTPSQYISPLGGLSLVMLRDNDPVEQYQINSVNVTAVPEPSTFIFGAAMGLMLLRKFKRVR